MGINPFDLAEMRRRYEENEAFRAEIAEKNLADRRAAQQQWRDAINFASMFSDTGLSYASGSLSCVLSAQELQTSTGPRRAVDILRDVEQGRPVMMAVAPYLGMPERRTARVAAACPTTAEAVEVTYVDGRSVRLTIGHALPGDDQRPTIIAGRPAETQSMVDHTLVDLEEERPVRCGDLLGDGQIASVTPLGRCEAVRIWLDGPEWMTTPQGLRVGSRWHEVAEIVALVAPAPYYTDAEDGPRRFDAIGLEIEQHYRFGRVLAAETFDRRLPANLRNIRSALNPYQTAYHRDHWCRYGSESYRITNDHTDPTAHWESVERQRWRGVLCPQSVLWAVDPSTHARQNFGALDDARLVVRPATLVTPQTSTAAVRLAA